MGTKIVMSFLPTSHAGPHSLVGAFAGFRRKRLWHDLFHNWTGNNILRLLGGESGLPYCHGNLGPVMHTVQHRLRQRLTIRDRDGPQCSRTLQRSFAGRVNVLRQLLVRRLVHAAQLLQRLAGHLVRTSRCLSAFLQ